MAKHECIIKMRSYDSYDSYTQARWELGSLPLSCSFLLRMPDESLTLELALVACSSQAQ